MVRNEKKALLYGKREARYHSIRGVDLAFSEILPRWQITVTEDTSVFESGTLSEYDMVILYEEFEERPWTDRETAGLLSYTAGGGGVMVLHNGISVQTRPELAQLLGAVFVSHPPYEKLPVLTFAPSGGGLAGAGHPVMKGITGFLLADEAYQFQFDSFVELEILMEYQYEGGRYPAAWVRGYGMGRVAYCYCGHEVAGFGHPQVRRWISNCVDWLTENRER